MPVDTSSTLSLATQAGGYASAFGHTQSAITLSGSAGLLQLAYGDSASYLLLSTGPGGSHAVAGHSSAALLLATEAAAVADGERALLGQPIQYAVNAASGALARYQGFGFDAFARCRQTLYGARPGGLYRIRPGSDDGEPISALIDLGELDLGSARSKALDAVWIGGETDGQVSVRLMTGGHDYSYPALAKGEMLRAVPGKGLKGREWRIEASITDATELEIDLIELSAGAADRRWTR